MLAKAVFLNFSQKESAKYKLISHAIPFSFCEPVLERLEAALN